MSLDDDRPLYSEPPPPGVRRAVAGLSCGMAGAGHTRTLIRCEGSSELRRRVRAWRCACGRQAVGSWD